MSLGSAPRQKSGKPERIDDSEGEARAVLGRDEVRPASHEPEGLGRDSLLRQALSRGNMVEAWKRVKANKGSAGVDGLLVLSVFACFATACGAISLFDAYRRSEASETDSAACSASIVCQ
jgi:hypothetical protein